MYDDLPKAPPPPLDVADGDLIERAWVKMDNRRYKSALKYKYVREWKDNDIARKFREREVAHFMLMAVASLSISVEKL